MDGEGQGPGESRKPVTTPFGGPARVEGRSLDPSRLLLLPVYLVGERSMVGRRQTVRTAGRSGSENAGMSSEKESENLSRRKPKVS